MNPMQTISQFSESDVFNMPPEITKIFKVPVVDVATSPEMLRGFGYLLTKFDPNDVEIVPWPIPEGNRRQLVPGTGIEGGVVTDKFIFERIDNIQYATNYAVKRKYITGWYESQASTSDSSQTILKTHEANYHPCGGQIIFPCENNDFPFIALLAPPGDDVRPKDFKAFKIPKNHGIHINPNVWHQPVYPIISDDKTKNHYAEFYNAQGRVHACVSIDFVAEWGLYLAFDV